MSTFELITNIFSIIGVSITVLGLIFILIAFILNNKRRKLVKWVENLQMFVPLNVDCNLSEEDYKKAFKNYQNDDISIKYFNLLKIWKINKIWKGRYQEIASFCDCLGVDWKKYKNDASEFQGIFRETITLGEGKQTSFTILSSFNLDNITTTRDGEAWMEINESLNKKHRKLCVLFSVKNKIGEIKLKTKILDYFGEKYEVFSFNKINAPSAEEIVEFNLNYGFTPWNKMFENKKELDQFIKKFKIFWNKIINN